MKFLLKQSAESIGRRENGRLFRARGAATANARVITKWWKSATKLSNADLSREAHYLCEMPDNCRTTADILCGCLCKDWSTN